MSGAASPNHTLIPELRRRYGVGPAYAAAYLEFWSRPDGRQAGKTYASVDEILALPAPDSVWFDYALSTNQRARVLRDLVLGLPESPHGAGRFLDIGCGFGGLLAAFASRGFDVRGIELDPDRVRLAEANCRDQGLEHVVFAGDILDHALVARLGRFDVITMIDVIEHVLDADKTLAHVAWLLAPGGVALLEIPNRDSLRFVAADGHFGLFGITLLDRPLAMAYQQARFAFPYDVGDYAPLDDYAQALDALGCDLRLVESPIHPAAALAEAPRLLDAIAHARARYQADVAPGLPAEVAAAVDERVDAFLAGAAGDLRAAAAPGPARTAFTTRYLLDFWTVAVTRRPSG